MSIFSDDNGSSSNGYGYDMHLVASSLYALAAGALGNPGFATNVVVKDEWQHLCVTWDRGISHFYANGHQVGEGLDDDSLGSNIPLGFRSTTMMIGGTGTKPFIGKLDQVQVYRTALNAVQVKWLWVLQDPEQGRVHIHSSVPSLARVEKEED